MPQALCGLHTPVIRHLLISRHLQDNLRVYVGVRVCLIVITILTGSTTDAETTVMGIPTTIVAVDILITAAILIDSMVTVIMAAMMGVTADVITTIGATTVKRDLEIYGKALRISKRAKEIFEKVLEI